MASRKRTWRMRRRRSATRALLVSVYSGLTVFLLACTRPADERQQEWPSLNTTWRRLGEGYVRPSENLYQTFDKYPKYGVVDYYMDEDPAKVGAKREREQLTTLLQTCRIDFAPAYRAGVLQPTIKWIVAIVRNAQGGKQFGAIFSAGDVFVGDRDLRELVRCATIDRNPRVFSVDPAKVSSWSEEKYVCLPLVENHIRQEKRQEKQGEQE